jgi:hypothetical protein
MSRPMHRTPVPDPPPSGVVRHPSPGLEPKEKEAIQRAENEGMPIPAALATTRARTLP